MKIALAALVLALAGCTAEEIQATDPHDVQTIAPNRVNGPFAQAGATFHVKLDGPIGTQLSHEGDEFTATIADNVLDTGGNVIVPEGSKLHGRVVGITLGVAPRIRLSFNRVEKADGTAMPIDARILEAQRMTYPGEPLYATYPSDPSAIGDPWMSHDTVLQYSAADTYYSREIQIPTGSDMLLELTRPLLGPGTTVTGR